MKKASLLLIVAVAAVTVVAPKAHADSYITLYFSGGECRELGGGSAGFNSFWESLDGKHGASAGTSWGPRFNGPGNQPETSPWVCEDQADMIATWSNSLCVCHQTHYVAPAVTYDLNTGNVTSQEFLTSAATCT